MGSFSIWHWLVVGIIILLLFGKGRFSDMMGDVAKGIKSFKKGMTEEEEANAAPPPQQRLHDARPLDPHPVDPRPVDPRPVEPRPADTRPLDTQAEARPVTPPLGDPARSADDRREP